MSASTDAMELTDLTDEVMFLDPFPRYAHLRRNAPVSRAMSPGFMRKPSYLLTRYADVKLLHADRRFSSDAVENGNMGIVRHLPRVFRLLTDSMVFKDDPEHSRLRGLVSQAFTPKLVAQMAGDIDRIVDELLDELAAKDGVDLVEDYAVQLPLAVISDMLGVGEVDRAEFHTSVKRFTDGSSSAIGMLKALPSARRMMKLFERLAEDARRHPDGRLISGLVEANFEEQRLGEDELLAMIFLLLLAGHDTTSNLIGTAVLALLDHPEQLARLRDDHSLIDSAVEELLRYTTPVPCGAPRFTLDDVDVSGVTIPKGSAVLGMIISANHDETVFDEPESLDLGRESNRHLAFAFGPHFCLGNQLARLEARSALLGLVRRFDHIDLAVPRQHLRYKSTISLRGLRSLPLRLRSA